jgi:hypothetical protein
VKTVVRCLHIFLILGHIKIRDSSVGVALGYGLDDRGSRVRFPAGAGNFSLHHRVQNGSGDHPPSYLRVPGTLSLGVRRPGREADHSPPSSVEVKVCVELYLRYPNTPLWRGAQLKEEAQGQLYILLGHIKLRHILSLKFKISLIARVGVMAKILFFTTCKILLIFLSFSLCLL